MADRAVTLRPQHKALVKYNKKEVEANYVVAREGQNNGDVEYKY